MLRCMDEKPPHAPLSDELIEAIASRFRLLGAPSRLKILNAVLDGPRTMTELQVDTGLEQSNLSRRVGELETGGVVRRSRRGRQVLVETADGSLHELCTLVCESLRRQLERAHEPFLAVSNT